MAFSSLRLGVRNPNPKLQSLLAQERVNGLQIWQVHLQGPCEQKPIKNFGEKGVWAYPGSAHFLSTPIMSGTGKLWTSNLAGTLTESIQLKAH